MGKLALFCAAVSILFSLLTADNIPTDPKFDPAKLSGKWHPILTGSYQQPPLNYVFSATPKPLGKGAFSVKFEILVNGTCQVLKCDLTPVKPGIFKIEGLSSALDFISSYEKTFVNIIETDYKQHLIYLSKMGNDKILRLLAKKSKVSLKWINKFKHFAKELRLHIGKVQDVPYADICPSKPKKKL